MSRQYFYQQSNDSFYNQSVTFCPKNNLTVYIIRLKPYAALASFNQILLCLIFFFQRFLLISQVNK